MPTRRRRSAPTVKTPLNKRRITIGIVSFIILSLLILIIKGLIDRTENYFTVAEALPSGDLAVSYVDLPAKELFTITIPKDTEVNLARQRGMLRASSIKKIIDSEDVDRQIIADTVTKTFHFPIDYWRMGITTDMPPILRLRTKFVELTGMSRENLDLSETSYLISTKLPDGEEGYRVRDTMPLSLQSIFADSLIAEDRLAVHIVNKSGRENYYLNNIIDVLGILGMKVAPIDDEPKDDSECSVISLHEEALRRVSSVLNCNSVKGSPSAFDLEIIFGEKFLERF